MKNEVCPTPFDKISQMENYNPNTSRPDMGNDNGFYSVLYYDDELEALYIYRHRSVNAADSRFRSLLVRAQKLQTDCRIIMVNDDDFEIQEVTLTNYC